MQINSKKNKWWFAGIALLALVAFILPVFLTKESRPSVTFRSYANCQLNLDLLDSALEEYAQEHGGFLPNPSNIKDPYAWVSYIVPYLHKDGLNVGQTLFCPQDTLHKSPSSYAMNINVYGKNKKELAKSSIPLLSENESRHPGRNILMSNGGVVDAP